ncbi:MAG: hypothetical protein DWQ01_04950 [Planctomycetota bacterium]|nr:MAG: hypothetical protein DWQ01_04950 [Planctomycetota bacterium]
MLRFLIIALTGSSFATGLVAQTQLPVQKAVTPKHAGIYRMASGELEPAGMSERSGPTVVIFNASELGNYYASPGTFGANEEWVDEGSLLDRNNGNWEQMNKFDFTYCSEEPDPTQNSGTITIAFYEDTVVCSGPSNGGSAACGGYLCAYDITDLPLGTPLGIKQCWFVEVDLRCGFECPPDLSFDWGTDYANLKLFGWSFVPRNNNTGPHLSKGGTQSAGIDNSLVWIDSNCTVTGCHDFGGTPYAQFAMKMYGNDPNIRHYNAKNPGSCDDYCLTMEDAPAGQHKFEIFDSASNSTDGWLMVSLGSAEQPVSCGHLLIALPILPPTPIYLPAGGMTTFVPPGTFYLQGASTPTGGPPHSGNLPDHWTNGIVKY